MTDFWNNVGPRFKSLPPAPMGEWKGLVARARAPFAAEFAYVSPLIGSGIQGLPILKNGPAQPYLPLEALRDEKLGALLHRKLDVARTFRSSGTTQENRSTARFSAAGLECYRIPALYTFNYVLNAVAGIEAADSGGMLGISLVPPVATWGESSLAQMVAWIAETMPVTYADVDDFKAAVTKGDDRPVWIFATAFHLVDLFDRDLSITLPTGSVVFETGGTKGRTRSVTREELYRDITKHLGVPDEKIVSEYGMCELAAQAYDFVEPGQAGPRKFRFPKWVQPYVVTGLGEAERTGRGALLVEDPMRVDAPWPIRVEDLVELDESGFRLLGRLPKSPLKGCSLLVEPVVSPYTGITPTTVKAPSDHAPLVRNARIRDVLSAFLNDKRIATHLTTELGSSAAALSAIEDLRQSIPPNADAWAAAIDVAAGTAPLPKHWLFVLPDNHSLVGLYPLAFGAALGLSITVRMPKSFPQESVLSLFIESLRAASAHIDTVSSDLRIRDAHHDFDAILAYGDDDTIAELALVAGCPVQGFGGRFGMSFVDGTALATEAPLLVRDALSLGQRGCMSSRVSMLFDDGTLDAFDAATIVASAARSYWQAAIPAADRIGHDLEAWRYARLGFRIAGGEEHDAPLVVARRFDIDELTPEVLHDVIAQRAFTLPLLIVNKSDSHFFVKAAASVDLASRPIGALTASLALMPSIAPGMLAKSGYPGLSFRPLGAANAPVWDGCHETRPLFAPRIV